MDKHASLIIKIGTNVLADTEIGKLNVDVIAHLVRQIAELRKQNHHIILVSSGAVGAGWKALADTCFTDKRQTKQVQASVGQVKLMSLYDHLFGNYGIPVAQVLVTKKDFEIDEYRTNLHNCITNLVSLGIMPIINENDVVSTNELLFTDNDELAKDLALLVSAGRLMILTNVDGVYRTREDGSREIFQTLTPDDTWVFDHIQKQQSSFGSGGMYNKLTTAFALAREGISVQITNGKTYDAVVKAVKGDGVYTEMKQR